MVIQRSDAVISRSKCEKLWMTSVYRRGSIGGGKEALAPPLPPKNPHKYEFVWLNSLRQHNSQARIQGLAPSPTKSWIRLWYNLVTQVGCNSNPWLQLHGHLYCGIHTELVAELQFVLIERKHSSEFQQRNIEKRKVMTLRSNSPNYTIPTVCVPTPIYAQNGQGHMAHGRKIKASLKVLDPHLTQFQPLFSELRHIA